MPPTIDKDLTPVNIPLNGRCITAADPSLIGLGSFQKLVNLRPGPLNPEPIMGMSKINTNIAMTTQTDLRRGIHFKKDYPWDESYLLIHSRNGAGTNSRVVYLAGAPIPSPTNFTDNPSVFTDSNNVGIPRFSKAPLGMVAYCNGTDTALFSGNFIPCAGYVDYDPAGSYRYNYTRQITSELDDDNSVALVHNIAGTTTLLVCSSLPVEAVWITVKTPNTTPGSVTISYFNSSGSWTSVGAVGGVGTTPLSAAQTYKWTFASTADTARPKVEEGTFGYWYKIVITNCNATTKISRVMFDAPMQQIRDIWDGTYRKVSSFQKYQSDTYNDLTVNVFKEDWQSDNAATFAEIDSLPTGTGFLVGGFLERMMGVRICLIGGHVNTTAATTMVVKYWDGSAWVSVGTITDGTSEGGISLAKSGVVMWNPPALASEFETDLPGASRPEIVEDGSDQPSRRWPFNQTPMEEYWQKEEREVPGTKANFMNRPQMYYYRIEFDQTLSADVQIYFVGGIPVQKELKGYDFPFYHLDRLWLAKGNKLIASSQGTSQVFNGEDCLEFSVGDESDLMGAASLTTRAGNSIYAVLLLFKKGQIWIMLGSSPGGDLAGPFRISDSIGLTAHETLAVIPSFEIAPGISRPIAVWQASDGIYMSDGFSMNLISQDIADKFDDRKSTCINRSYASSSFGGYSEKNNEYHWCYAEGSSTTPNREWVYKFGKPGWYQVDRTTGKELRCFIPVKDTSGNAYLYGTMAGGYVVRLDHGATFDGAEIPYTFRPADLALAGGDLSVETKARFMKIIARANNDTGNRLVATHYVDGDVNGRVIDQGNNLPLSVASRRIVQIVRSFVFDGVLHSTEFSFSSGAGSVGFEPLFLSYYVIPWRLDKGLSTGTPVA